MLRRFLLSRCAHVSGLFKQCQYQPLSIHDDVNILNLPKKKSLSLFNLQHPDHITNAATLLARMLFHLWYFFNML